MVFLWEKVRSARHLDLWVQSLSQGNFPMLHGQPLLWVEVQLSWLVRQEVFNLLAKYDLGGNK